MNNDKSIIIDHYGNVKFWLYIAPEPRVPYILDFEDKKVLENLINPNEVVIKDEKITMNITYPLSVEVNRTLEKKGGSRGWMFLKTSIRLINRFTKKKKKVLVTQAHTKIYITVESPKENTGYGGITSAT
ncbi:MAG: hypothetical protein ACTSPS_14100 [Promethearchaeota archaeon]